MSDWERKVYADHMVLKIDVANRHAQIRSKEALIRSLNLQIKDQVLATNELVRTSNEHLSKLDKTIQNLVELYKSLNYADTKKGILGLGICRKISALVKARISKGGTMEDMS